MEDSHKTTNAKALAVNLDESRYGAFAEIGAGQEVARHFFLAGRASQTIAKTISAYDMIYSDEIYGKEKNGRYVCESRLIKMLDKEYSLLIRRLDATRGSKTNFFAFANTVATGTPESPRCHGWMGVRFQKKPNGPFNDIILHVRMQDRHRLQQQEALGVLGVNLIHAAFYELDPDEFISSLMENLKSGQVIIDVLKFSGPDVKIFDNRIMNIELVKRGLAEAVLFSPQMEILNLSDVAYGKSILLQRGAYRPITKSHLDVLEKGLAQFKKEKNVGEIIPILEIAVEDGKNNTEQDYLNRIEIMTSLGHHVLISHLPLFYHLKRFFRKYTQKPLAIVMSANYLEKLFDPKHYADLEGGLLEALGKLLDPQAKLLIYPHKTDKLCLTAKTYHPAPPTDSIYKYFLELNQISDISGCDEISNYYHSEDVIRLLKKSDKKWEELVPSSVKSLIEKKFG